MAGGLAALATAVDDAVGVPVADLCAAELQDRIPALARQRDRIDGWLSAAAGQLQASTGGKVATDDGGERGLAGWLAEVTRTSSGAAGSRLRTSTALRDLPLIVQAVLDGVISQDSAAILARLVGKIPLEHLIERQDDLILVATDRDPTALEHWVRHQIATHVEPVLDDAEASAHAKRHLTTRRGADGSVQGSFRLAAGDGEPLLTAIEALARKHGDADRRSAPQRRADALTELAEQVLGFGELPAHGGQRPTMSYVLPADWAARLHDRTDCPTCSSCALHRPASFADTVAAALPGSPGIPAEWACATAAWTGPATRGRLETLLCDARISRVLLDPTGQVKNLQALRDTVTATQRRALAARDGRCVARGCTRPPAVCDAHHLIPLAASGPTTLGNLVHS